jgi:VWFA-related protein
MRTLLLVAAAIGLFFPALVRVSAQSTPEPTVTVNVNVREVSLDLIVRDSKGKVVRNLAPGDVQILENGVEQKVNALRFVEGREITAPAGGTAVAQAGRVAPLRTSNLVCIVLHNLDVPTRRFAMAAVQEFAAKPLPPGTWVGVFSLGSGLSVLQQFTTDRNAVMLAARKAFVGMNADFSTSAAMLNSANPAEMQIVNSALLVTGGEINNGVFNDVGVTDSLGANTVRAEQAEDRQKFGGIAGQRTYDQVQNMIRQLGSLPGHKTVLLLSPGMITTGVDPDKFKSLLTAANNANLTFYAIDVNGMDMNSSLASGNNMLQTAAAASQRLGNGQNPDNGVNGAASASGLSGQAAAAGAGNVTMNNSMNDSAAVARQSDVLHDAVRGSNLQAPLRTLAEGTGGAFSSGNDLRKPFQHIVDDLGAHYEVVYKPAADVWDGRLRTIEVKTRAGLTVESRKAYFALPDPQMLKAFDAPALLALGTNPLPHTFDFSEAAYQFRPQGATSQYAVAVAVPGSIMTATAHPEQKQHRLHVSVLALVKDSKGEVVDKVSRDYPLTIADDKLEAAQAETLNATLPFQVGPGHYTVETAVVDFEGRRASTGTLEIDNDAERKGPGLSSLVLVSRAEALTGRPDASNPFEFQDKRMVPMIGSALKPTDQPYLYFVVYPDKSNKEKAQIQVEFLVDGESLAKQSADLPAADGTGAVPMVVGAAVKTGECELKITAMQGNASTTQSVKYTVADQ